MKQHLKNWILWLALNVLIGGYFAYALFAPASIVKGSLLPGETTHGHYQIELSCDACHSPANESTSNGSVGAVMQDACNRCHESQLEAANDTHPSAKFNDPTNADLLLTLNAQDCLTCHKEHVPEQTRDMGLTVPKDYCWHCHQEVADSRPSHEGMSYDSCATAGCHNYHDNRALYEKYLNDNHGQPDHLTSALQPEKTFAAAWAASHPEVKPLALTSAEAPSAKLTNKELLKDWAETKHAAAGVNCTGCHAVTDAGATSWNDAVAFETCQSCHEQETESFLTGKHGMRLALGMSPKTPATARLDMHRDSLHSELTCNACHQGHRFDTQFAAVQACQGCHADSHSVAYQNSPHAELWRQEIAGDAPTGSGVSCATCHMPRIAEGDSVWVNHDQNAGLRPNETMAREVCQNCHGLEYSLSALADPELVETNYDRAPSETIKSVQMAHDWFEQQRKKREARAQRRKQKQSPSPSP